MNESSSVRVRFAPSPTGYLHVGGARTALFNWLFARHTGGKFILRIEDTDLERSTAEMVDGILSGLRWLGLDWDEGPFFQSERMPSYRAMAARLVESGHAYYCFCAKEELERQRAAALAQGGTAIYDRTCRRLDPADARRRRAAGEPCAVRFAVPDPDGAPHLPPGQCGMSTGFEDAVFGRVEVANREIEDFVLLRSDGGPTYHLSVVADDLDMRVTHIIRGADHLSNTPKQVMLYQALGAPMPVFAHVPLILGPDKTRLSKRHGATSVMAYRDEGIVPEAFRNFLALLGWTPPDASREILPDRELFARFSLEGIARSNAVFDRAKLDWFNSEYIRSYPAEKLLPLAQAAWAKAGLKLACTDRDPLLKTIEVVKPRARSLKDFAGSFRAFFTDEYQPDPAAVQKFLKDTSVRTLLAELGARYAASHGEFTEENTEKVLREFAAEKQVKAGMLINGARVALTGEAVAPSLFTVMLALGKERTVARLQAAPAIPG